MALVSTTLDISLGEDRDSLELRDSSLEGPDLSTASRISQLLTSSFTASRKSILSEALPLEFEEYPDFIELLEDSLESEEDLELSLDAINEKKESLEPAS